MLFNDDDPITLHIVPPQSVARPGRASTVAASRVERHGVRRHPQTEAGIATRLDRSVSSGREAEEGHGGALEDRVLFGRGQVRPVGEFDYCAREDRVKAILVAGEDDPLRAQHRNGVREFALVGLTRHEALPA